MFKLGSEDRQKKSAVGTCRLYLHAHSLNLMWSATSSQWRVWRRNWVKPRWYFRLFDTTRAEALKTRCSLSVVFLGAPTRQ